MRAELRDSLEFLYTDSQVGRRPRHEMSLDVPRGGIPAVHVLLDGLAEGAAIRAAAHGNGRPLRGARWFRLVDVPVEKNTGPVGFVEKDGEENPHVARRAPFRVFDAMEPVDATVRASAGTVALRLHLPRATRAGSQQYRVAVESGGDRQELALRVTVHGAGLPAVGAASFPYTNWFSLEQMASRHGLEPWSPGHWRMIRRYAELMVHGRQNTFWVPLHCIFTTPDGRPVLDPARLRRLVDLFTAAGMHYIEGGHVAHRTGGEWQATTFDVAFGKDVRATSAEGNALLASIGQQLRAQIDRQGWHDRWIQHVTDEPASTNATDYRILCGMVRRHLPGLPLLDATEDPGMAGSVDYWCPQAQEYQRHREAFEAARQAGDRVWFYTCCFPGGPWLNRLLDEELLRPCLFGWGAALFGLDGFLHWGLNHYKSFQDPFQQSVVDHGGHNELPAGDTHIVYPGRGGPWSSLRLEAQREGIEDYELLKELKLRDPRRAGQILRRVIRGFDDYTRSAAVVRQARRALLEALG
ncbi:MAG: DUF4091 domain-containing protein [Candidatus Latescibacterota bacterium]